jgi:hypothetical protein
MHQHYEELCTLAATGQIDSRHHADLSEHLASCEQCQAFLDAAKYLGTSSIPIVAASRAARADAQPPKGIRERFLKRAAIEGLNISPGPVLAVPSKLESSIDSKQPVAIRGYRIAWRVWLRIPPIEPAYAALTVVSCVAFAILGYMLAAQRNVTSIGSGLAVTASTSLSPPASESKPQEIDSDRVSKLQRQKSDLEAELTKIKQELATSERDRETLYKELADGKEKLAILNSEKANEVAPTVSTIPQSDDRVSSLQSHVGQLNQKLAESEVNLALQKQTSDELSARLDATAADLQRERNLKAAKSEMGELVAARNLHIVDVYDAEPNGRVQRSFGRVFYIEGKSLVFYAYDLDDSKRFRANVVFHVWGEKADLKEVTHSLGILHLDDAGQNRWAMTFDVPKVLSEINSVFVTAESPNKNADSPHGRKVLYAYFGGQPNHPSTVQ